MGALKCRFKVVVHKCPRLPTIVVILRRNREFQCISGFCFSCRDLAQLGLQKLCLPVPNFGKSKWGLSNGGLGYFSSIVHDRLQLSCDLFSRVLFFLFAPFAGGPLFPRFSQHIFALFSPSKSALCCRAKGTAHSLKRGNFRMDLSTKFGKEIPSRNLRAKRSVLGFLLPGTRPELLFFLKNR